MHHFSYLILLCELGIHSLASKRGHWESDSSNTIRIFGTYMSPGIAPGQAGSREKRQAAYNGNQKRLKAKAEYQASQQSKGKS